MALRNPQAYTTHSHTRKYKARIKIETHCKNRKPTNPKTVCYIREKSAKMLKSQKPEDKLTASFILAIVLPFCFIV